MNTSLLNRLKKRLEDDPAAYKNMENFVTFVCVDLDNMPKYKSHNNKLAVAQAYTGLTTEQLEHMDYPLIVDYKSRALKVISKIEEYCSQAKP